MTVETKPTAHKSLMDALLAAQAEMPKVEKSATNPHFKSKYVSLDALIEKVTPVLNKHGLIWTTLPVLEGGEPALAYKLIHAGTGSDLGGVMPLLLTKADPQGLGSALTYARRYSLSAVLNIAADEDDDGNTASQGQRAQRANGARVSSAPAEATSRVASAKQRGLINGKAGEKGLPPMDLANIVLAATESELRDFESQSDAESWLRRAMDRLPAKHVDAVLAGIEHADPVEEV